MTHKLGQVVGIEGNVKKVAVRRQTEAYHALDKQQLLEGIRGEYRPLYEDGEQLPGEELRVQATVEDMIKTTFEALAPLFDVTAAKDFTNCSGTAKADVVVGEIKLVGDAPMPYLLWLNRQLDHLEAFVNRMPTHSPATTWSQVEDRGVYESAPVKTMRTVAHHKVITLAAATERHPAQTQLVQESLPVGEWTRMKYTGAIPVARREQMLARISKLRNAVQVAREECNRVEAIEPVVGAKILGYVFG